MVLDFYDLLSWLKDRFADQRHDLRHAVRVGYNIDEEPLVVSMSPIIDLAFGLKRRLREQTLANAYFLTFNANVYHTSNSADKDHLPLSLSLIANHVQQTLVSPLIYAETNPYFVEDIRWVNTTYSEVLEQFQELPYQVANVSFEVETDSIPFA